MQGTNVEVFKANGHSEKLSLYFSEAELQWVAVPLKSKHTPEEEKCPDVILHLWKVAPSKRKGNLFEGGYPQECNLDCHEVRRIEMKRKLRRQDRSRSRDSPEQLQ